MNLGNVAASYDLGRGGREVEVRQAPLLVEKLSASEELELFELESCVRRAVDSQVEAAKALARIRDRRLYRAEFKTFEDYCGARWKMTGRRARQLADFFLVRRNLEDATPEYDLDSSQETPATVALPENERVVRRLAGRAPEVQRQVWKEATKAAGGKAPTARHVEEALGKRGTNGTHGTDETQGELLATRNAGALKAAERAVIAIRGLQDFFKGGDPDWEWCQRAVEHVENVERHLKRQPLVVTRAQRDDARQRADIAKIGTCHTCKRDNGVKPSSGAQDFVICREPSKGGIGVASRPRYRTASGGWTNDPALAKRYPDRVAAAAGDRYGKPMSLEKALRRFKLKL